MGNTVIRNKKYKLIKDNFTSYEELEQGLRKAGLENSQLIIGIDFTKSNTWQGSMPYYQQSNLHSLEPYPNPYQQVLQIMCKSLASFDDDNLIPVYGFGDSLTKDKSVFSFLIDEFSQDTPCVKLEGVLNSYNDIITNIENGII